MRLSIVIVNYNVRHFLEQALGSVRRAMQGIEGEVWVVDNNSADDSVRMVRERFPEVKLIPNTDNPGFAVANNQAIRQSAGEYVLLLNPDTLVEEDTFRKCLTFMDEHPDAGALGCKLLDGSGKFLPESKRGFPTPWVAFCKTFGLSTLFPRSPSFNRYHLGHLPENETNEVDVLAGCFMFLRKTALDKSGLLDEVFFMYGEDIDLSYRIQKAGFKNYYFPETKIIHYKGESTKKGTLNYVRTFYLAMIIFARKHFSGRRAGLFVMMLQAAIWFRAGLTLFRNFLGKTWLPALDALAIYFGLVLLKNFWASYYYHDPTWFKTNVLWFNFPLYILIWLGTVWLSGGYDTRYNLTRLLRGLGLGTLVLSAVYGFLDLDYRPSRALVLMGAAWAVFATIGIRLVTHFWEFGNFRLGRSKVKNLLVVGSENECARVLGLLNRVGAAGKNFIGRVDPSPSPNGGGNAEQLGNVAQLHELVRIYGANEIIFCSKDIGSQEIMANMAQIGPSVSYKIVPEESLSIIGSSSKDEPGELYTIDIRYNIAQPSHRRDKRLIDLCICLGLMISLPGWLLFSGKRGMLIKNWGAVLLGQKTWVGYAPNIQNASLPALRTGVFSPVDALKDLKVNEETAARLNFFFAKDWEVERDLAVFFKA
ncbi:MAG: glycosyltransferase [Saprospiraceae bacterium]|nr:glycosyltransferase [Saprospiraceae bacterium]